MANASPICRRDDDRKNPSHPKFVVILETSYTVQVKSWSDLSKKFLTDDKIIEMASHILTRWYSVFANSCVSIEIGGHRRENNIYNNL